MTLEDETGIANIIVWPKVFERLRPIVIGARFIAVTGKLQSEAGVIHVVADRMEDLTPMLGLLSERGPEIDAAMPADEARRSAPFGDEGRAAGERRANTSPVSLRRRSTALDAEERELLRAIPGRKEFSLRERRKHRVIRWVTSRIVIPAEAGI